MEGRRKIEGKKKCPERVECRINSFPDARTDDGASSTEPAVWNNQYFRACSPVYSVLKLPADVKVASTSQRGPRRRPDSLTDINKNDIGNTALAWSFVRRGDPTWVTRVDTMRHEAEPTS